MRDVAVRDPVVRSSADVPEALRKVEYDTRLTASAGGALVLMQPEICRNYNYYYDIEALGNRVTECGRFRQAAALDDGRVVGVRLEAGEAEVAVVGGEVLYRAAPGEAITGVAAGAARIAVTTLRAGLWSLVLIQDGKAEVVLSDAAIKHSPRIGDRDEVFFVAGYGKVYNVWSVGAGRLARWTDAAHGVREISAPYRGELLLTTIEPDGDALRSYRLPGAPLETRPLESVTQAAETQVPSMELADRPYSPWSSLAPRWWFPTIELAEGAGKLGATTSGQDALALHQYVVTAQYEFTQGELLGNLAYIYNGRHLLFLDRSMRVRETLNDEIEAYTIDESVDPKPQFLEEFRFDGVRLTAHEVAGAAGTGTSLCSRTRRRQRNCSSRS